MILASLFFSGCQASEHQPIPSARVAKPNIESKKRVKKTIPPSDRDVIWVNGSAIPMQKINDRLDSLVKFQTDQLSPFSKHQKLQQKKRIEDLFIGQALLEQHAKKEKILVSDRVVIDTLSTIVEKNFGSRAAFLAHLEFKSMTHDAYLDQLKTDMISKKIFNKIKVDKQEVLDRFFQDFQQEGIMMKAKVTLFQSSKKQVLPTMKYRDFRKQLANVQATHDLGWVSAKEAGIPKRVFSAAPNEVVSVANEDGTFFYWIMKKRKVLNPHFLMVKHRLRLSLLREKRESARTELISNLRKSAIIRYGIPRPGLTKPEDTRKKVPEVEEQDLK